MKLTQVIIGLIILTTASCISRKPVKQHPYTSPPAVSSINVPLVGSNIPVPDNNNTSGNNTASPVTTIESTNYIAATIFLVIIALCFGPFILTQIPLVIIYIRDFFMKLISKTK